jgi:hypothetical protein
MAIDNLRRVLAAPPRSEVLTVAEFEEAERKIHLVKQEKSKSGSSSPSRSVGTGFTYIQRKPSSPMTEEQKAKSREASQRAKERNAAAGIERNIRQELSTWLTECFHRGLDRLLDRVTKEAWEKVHGNGELDREGTHVYFEKTFKPVITKLSRECVKVEPLFDGRIAVRLAKDEHVVEMREELENLTAWPQRETKFLVKCISDDCRFWLDGAREKNAALLVPEESLMEA